MKFISSANLFYMRAFAEAYPDEQIVQQILKDPYNNDFLPLRDDYNERVLEQGLIEHVQKFLLELGAGFAFAGRQVHHEVGGEDFYMEELREYENFIRK